MSAPLARLARDRDAAEAVVLALLMGEDRVLATEDGVRATVARLDESTTWLDVRSERTVGISRSLTADQALDWASRIAREAGL